MAVRAAMQVDASLITESSQWRMIIDDLVDDLKYDLAIDGEVSAELYKLLIYEPGGHFKRLREGCGDVWHAHYYAAHRVRGG